MILAQKGGSSASKRRPLLDGFLAGLACLLEELPEDLCLSWWLSWWLELSAPDTTDREYFEEGAGQAFSSPGRRDKVDRAGLCG